MPDADSTSPASRKPVDTLGRPLHDLRISVIDKCNFRCPYCMPAEVFGPDYAFLKGDQLLTFEEIEAVSRAFVSLGVKKLRLTGGEPLLRKGITDLVALLAHIPGVNDIALTTNGVLLPRFADDLRSAGLSRVTVSMDALDESVAGKMNGRGVSSRQVLDGIAAAQAACLPVKVNMVVQRGANDNEVLPMARYFRRTGVILRFIEYMDVGNHNGWNMHEVVPAQEIRERISAEFPLEAAKANYPGEVANRFRYADGAGEIGIIASVTQPFCRGCTRARISADGVLYTCLFASKGTSLRQTLRSEGLTHGRLQDTIASIWRGRNDRYSEERTELLATHDAAARSKVEMSYIGG